MEANQSKGKRKTNSKEKKSNKSGCYLKQEYEKIKTKKEGLETQFFNKFFKDFTGFLGTYSQDQLMDLQINLFPVSLIVNLDLSTKPGSHWIALNMTDNIIEIYDSLGFQSANWGSHPKFLFKFLRKYKRTHRFISTPRLQGEQSFLCGFYCVFFLCYRKTYSFKSCISVFSTNLTTNDQILLAHIFKL